MKRSYGKPKDLFPMEIIVTDIDGKPVEGSNFWIKQTCSWVANEKGTTSINHADNPNTLFRRQWPHKRSQ